MYTLMNIIGPILLLAVIIFVTLKTWKKRPRQDAVSDASSRRVRAELNEEDTGVPNETVETRR